MAFDERVGLYDDPPNEEIVKMIKATFDGFKYMGKLNWGWEALLYRFVNTPSYRKFCESQDTLFAISQKIVDKKILELNKMAEDGEEFVKNQGTWSHDPCFLRSCPLIKFKNLFSFLHLKRRCKRSENVQCPKYFINGEGIYSVCFNAFVL